MHNIYDTWKPVNMGATGMPKRGCAACGSDTRKGSYWLFGTPKNPDAGFCCQECYEKYFEQERKEQ